MTALGNKIGRGWWLAGTVLLVLAAVGVAHWLDRAAWQWARDLQWHKAQGDLTAPPWIYRRQYGQLLYSYGAYPLWVAVWVGWWLADWRRLALRQVQPFPEPGPTGRPWWDGLRWRAWLVLVVPLSAGGLAEVVKVLVRRLRPAWEEAAYRFRPWEELPWYSGGLGMPSGHAATSMAGAVLLGCLWPGTGWWWVTLALGCGATRVLAGAHYLSDVTVGWLLGAAVGLVFYRLHTWLLRPRADTIAA